MNLFISKDYLNNPTPPDIFLCNTHKKKIGQLPAYSRSGNFKWNTYSEIQFEIDRTYVDIIDGETKIHPLYDKVEAPRNIYVRNIGYFALQDIDDTSSDKDSKSVTAFSLEYTTSNKYLTNFHINTGEVDSIEVLYNEQYNGIDYSSDQDSFYKISDGYDPYESYYKQTYTDNDSYIYEQVQIIDEADYNAQASKNNDISAQPYEKLYMKNFPNVQFYNPSRQGLSLLHLVFKHIPEWNIGNVDQVLWRKERKFSESRVSVYDFLNSNVTETFGCVIDWDTEAGLVHFYEEAEDGITEDNAVQTRWATDVYISKDNLANEAKVSYSSDDIKTKLVVTGSDDLDIREVNLGRNEIMDLSFYHTEDWMEQDLFERYDDYLEEIQEAQTGLDKDGLPSDKYPMSYPDAVQGWVSANNRYHELMHAVPSEDNVLLVGDEFKKLFCIYTPIDSAYAKDTIITNSTAAVTELYYDEKCTIPVTDMKDGTTHIVQGYKLTYSLAESPQWKVGENMADNSMSALVKKLNQYHIYEDIQGNKNDNILLKLKNAKSDVVTIRIYDPKTETSTYNENYGYYTKNDNNTYTRINNIKNQVELDNYIADNGKVYTNNYTIQSVVYYAASDITSAPSYWSMVIEDINGSTPKPFSDWVKGNLTAEEMGLVEYDAKDTERKNPIYYTVSHIGAMGAYFVLAKDEVVVTDTGILEISENYLKACGVNLLKEKHQIYTSLFQTQTEAMFSQEKYQCIVQDEQPEGDYKDGTRWLNTNSGSATLYKYDKTAQQWVALTGTDALVTNEDKYNYENYQRYLDNYNKLQAVQEVLVEKERQAEYCLSGFAVPDVVIDYSLYTEDDDGDMRYDGQLLQGEMRRAAEAHFGEGYTITPGDMDQTLPLYTFTTSFDPITYGKNTKSYSSIEQYYIKDNDMEIYAPITIEDQEDFNSYDGSTNDKTLYVQTSGHIFAVYLSGTMPYVAYANSQGVYQMIRDYIRNKTEMSSFFSEDQWIRLSPFIKEDEFNDSNFLLTGYESEEERISICEELMEAAAKELKTLCKPSLEFSMTMANILALPEFEPLVDQFQLGNFIRVEIREGYVKRSRLLEVNLNFDDLSDFSATFGNLVTTKSEIDKHAELLAQAVSAGKQVAKSGGTWQKTTEKTNRIESDIASGLQDATLRIKNASGQDVEIGTNGLIGRKLIEGTTNQYEDEQVALINNKLVFTADNWNTSKAAFGKFEYQGQERWGVLSDAIISGYISGSTIEGGNLKIGGDGGTFIVNEDGSVEILGPGGTTKYAAKELEDAYRFQILLEYDGSTVFLNRDDNCTITCKVYDNTVNITDKVVAQSGSSFVWSKSLDSTWEPTYVTDTDGAAIPNKILITHEDVERNASFACAVTFDETKFTTEGGASE